MNKLNQRMKFYTLAWAIAFVLFNIIAFAPIGGVVTTGSSFVVSRIFIDIAFIGQLLCALHALKEENNQKLFYNVSLISISYAGLIAMLIVALLPEIILKLFRKGIPLLSNVWFETVVCMLVLGFTAIAVVKTRAAIEEVERIDQKVKEQTFFIKSLTIDADAVVAAAKTAEIKEQAKKVYEAIRYSDPMSNPALNAVESQIADKFNEFASAAKIEDVEQTKSTAEELLLLIRNRNQKCKLLK